MKGRDILDIEITEIAPFPRKTKLTVDAAYVEFDYRCKIDGQYAIYHFVGKRRTKEIK